MSSLFLAIFIPNFLSAREKALANRKAIEEVHASSRNFQKEAVEAVREGRSVDATSLKQTLDNAGRNATGETAALVKGTSAYMQKLQALQDAYNAAAKEL